MQQHIRLNLGNVTLSIKECTEKLLLDLVIQGDTTSLFHKIGQKMFQKVVKKGPQKVV